MDDDDFYKPETIISRIKTLLVSKKECVGCLKTLCYDLLQDQTFEAYDASIDNKPSTISEATMGYTKEFWKKQQFNSNDTKGECLNFIKNRHTDIVIIPSTYVVIQLTHNTNTITRRLNNTVIDVIGLNFMKSISMRDVNIINEIKTNIIMEIPEWKESINFVKKNYNLNRKQFITKLEKKPDYIKINPFVIEQLRTLPNNSNPLLIL